MDQPIGLPVVRQGSKNVLRSYTGDLELLQCTISTTFNIILQWSVDGMVYECNPMKQIFNPNPSAHP